MKPCPTAVTCPCDNNPLTNYSSEAPDKNIFLGFSSGWGTTNGPNPGDNGGPNAFDFCESTVSQEEADLCAADHQIGDLYTPPDGVTRPSGGSPTLFYNSDQSCTVVCPDGLPYTYTLAAGKIRSLDPTYSDRIANSIACLRANSTLICLPAIAGSACLGQFYEQELSVADTVKAPVDWHQESGSLPPGLHVEFDAFDSRVITITGTPTLAGNYAFVIRATDDDGNFMQKNYTIAVLAITNSPTPASVGTPYSFQFTAAGGVAPYTFSVTPGNLPDGLSMSSSGLITGTPTDNTPTTFTLSVTDSAP